MEEFGLALYYKSFCTFFWNCLSKSWDWLGTLYKLEIINHNIFYIFYAYIYIFYLNVFIHNYWCFAFLHYLSPRVYTVCFWIFLWKLSLTLSLFGDIIGLLLMYWLSINIFSLYLNSINSHYFHLAHLNVDALKVLEKRSGTYILDLMIIIHTLLCDIWYLRTIILVYH